MQRIVGRSASELSDKEYSLMAAGFDGVCLDLGTGDGKHALAWSRSCPNHLIVGVDTNIDSLRKTSRQAAKPAQKGGQPNLLYIRASAEKLPAVLRDVIAIHILMPWGTLLRGVLEPSTSLLSDLSDRCRDGALFIAVINLHAWRPRVPEVSGLPEPLPDLVEGHLIDSYRSAGWALERVRLVSNNELVDFSTSWTSRLRSSRSEFMAVALEGRRAGRSS